MNYDQPLYRCTTEGLASGYSTRILLGVLASLAGVVLLTQLPLSPAATSRIGWTTRPAERIALSAVQQQEEDPQESSSAPEGAPPPTQHGTSSASPDAPGTGDGADGGPTLPEPPSDEEEQSSSLHEISTLSTEDEQPEIKGGMGAFYLHIQYPPVARQKGIEGELELRFTVETDGSVRQIRVVKSLHPVCDSAAVEALRSVTFAPGTHEGEPVPVRMSLPVRFMLRSAPDPLRNTQLPNSSS